MSMVGRAVTAGVLLAASGGALAVEPNSLDVYYVDSTVDVSVPGLGSGDEDGNGYGVRGAFALSEFAALTAEYQTVNYDRSDIDFEQFRGGLMVGLATVDAPLNWYGLVEYIHTKADDGFDDVSNSGYGVHIGGDFELMPGLALGARVGYVDIDESDGIEWLVEGEFAATPTLGLFADYRLTSVKDNDDVETELDDLRLGVRLRF